MDDFEAGETLPPPALKPAATCGALPFVIRRDGTWLYRGSPIRRKPMVCLFASTLRRDAQGGYRLQTPVEQGTIEVEDAPFVATELEWHGCGRAQVLSFRTNVDEVICAGPEHPIRCAWDVPCDGCGTGPVPYLHIRDGDGAWPIEARIARAVYYELAALAVAGHHQGVPCLGVWSRNVFFPLSTMPDDGCA